MNIMNPHPAAPAQSATPLLAAAGLTMDYSAASVASDGATIGGTASRHPRNPGPDGRISTVGVIPAGGSAPAVGTIPGLSGVPAAPHTLALDHVDFTLGDGETVAVMGPSGSGKSTLLHALAGIIRPTAGTVTFRGADLGAMSDAQRTALRRGAFGFVFQSGQLLPELPAVENIALPMMLGGVGYREATDAAILWLERLGLRHLAGQRPGEMSGGQMQRIAIARALAVRPAVVFADEPTGALDQATGRDVMAILMEAAHANGSAVVVVTHDPNVAAFCSRTVMMRDGRLDGGSGGAGAPMTAFPASPATPATPAGAPVFGRPAAELSGAQPADSGRGWIGGAR